MVRMIRRLQVRLPAVCCHVTTFRKSHANMWPLAIWL